jgi:glycosyltransferase involved in cell wall biosynthesis
MKRPSVLIIIENLPAPFDRRVWMEARTLRDAGYQVSIICPVGKGYTSRFEVLEDIAIYRHPMSTEASGLFGYIAEFAVALFWEFVLAAKIALGRGFDVVQACNPPDLIFLTVLPFKLFGKKFIFDHHDLCPELYEAKFGKRGAFYNVLRVFERLTFWAADVSIATNESYKAVAMGRGRMAAEDVFVVRSGPERLTWNPQPGVDSWRSGRKHLVGYLGVMGEQEGIDLLIEAIGLIVNRHGRSDVQFVLIGDGTERPSLEAQVEREGLSDYVRFTGRIGDTELIEALSTADVLVNPDRPSELNDKSTMNKIVEYMAMAKPIIQFEMKEGRFSAQDGSLYARAGDVADFADRIIELLDDPERRLAMGVSGRARFENALCWEHQRSTLLAAYARARGGKAVGSDSHGVAVQPDLAMKVD